MYKEHNSVYKKIRKSVIPTELELFTYDDLWALLTERIDPNSEDKVVFSVQLSPEEALDIVMCILKWIKKDTITISKAKEIIEMCINLYPELK